MKIIFVLAICLAIIGCKHRDLTEYSLDANSFDAEAITKIERESGIDLPDGAEGLAFHHIPPIDPIVFAKIRIPATEQDSIFKQIEALTLSGPPFAKDLANDSCRWWPTAPEEVILYKQAYNNGFYMELYLLKEKDDIMLYIHYFTF